MSKKIKADQLLNEIQGMLESYCDEVIEDTKDTIDEVSKEAHKIVKTHAPVGNRKDRKGKYKKSIKVRTSYESLTEKKKVIYVADGEHRLAHLLEHGHAKINGGRTQAHPHFSYGEEYVEKNIEKKIKNKLGG